MSKREKVKKYLESKDKKIVEELLKRLEFDITVDPNNIMTKLNISIVKEVLGQ